MAFHVVLINAIAALIFLAAFLRGGTPERICAAILTARFVLVPIYLWNGPLGFEAVDNGLLAIDLVIFAGTLWLALRANRVWPLWICSAQLIVILGHLSVFVAEGGMQKAYWAMTQLPEVLQFITLALGVRAHRKRFRRIGPYRDWS